jgi:8-oxo-dGTP pyrophosphatase MutT (NUDIX family)
MYRAESLQDVLRPALEAAPRLVSGPDARPAAVLIPVLVSGGEARLVFTKRTDTLSRHAGEISFPGGLLDEGEEAGEGALREAEEELGLLPQDVELLGALPAVHTHVTGILIVPFVGILRADPRYTPNAAEIADVLEFRLEDLMARSSERELEHEGARFQTFVFEMDGHTIWGATARILRSFLDVLEVAFREDEE